MHAFGLNLPIKVSAASLALLLVGCQTTGEGAGSGRVAKTDDQAVRYCIDYATLNSGSPATAAANCDRAIAAATAAGTVLADLHNARARARATLYDLDGALADRQRAVEFDPGSAYRQRELGWGLYDLNRNAEALTAFDTALEGDAGNLNGLADRAAALRGLGRYDEALTAFRQAIEIDGTVPFFHTLRGNMLNNLGRHDEALAEADRALESYSGNGFSHRVRGWALVGLGRLDTAVEGFASAVAVAPADD